MKHSVVLLKNTLIEIFQPPRFAQYPTTFEDKLTRNVLALLHDLHPADGLVLLHLVGLVPRLAVGLVVGRADVGAERLVAALANHWRVTDVDRLVERL